MFLPTLTLSAIFNVNLKVFLSRFQSDHNIFKILLIFTHSLRLLHIIYINVARRVPLCLFICHLMSFPLSFVVTLIFYRLFYVTSSHTFQNSYKMYIFVRVGSTIFINEILIFNAKRQSSEIPGQKRKKTNDTTTTRLPKCWRIFVNILCIDSASLSNFSRYDVTLAATHTTAWVYTI